MNAERVRSHFPALGQDLIFMDNAAGAQVVNTCTEYIREYFGNMNVQPFFNYSISEQATTRINNGYKAGAEFINASVDEIVFGASTTQLARNLSTALTFQPGDEIVLSAVDHEGHLAGWVQVAEWKSLTIKWWIPSQKSESTNPKLEADDLEAQGLVNEKTRLVCFTHVSNILGSIADVSAICKTVKRINPKTLVSVDGVAYAPHAPIDVKAFGVDFYHFSWYKVYGPHMAMAFVKKSVQSQLNSLGHFFLPKTSADNLLNLAGGNFELVQSIAPITKYLRCVGWDWIKQQEGILQEELLRFIRSRPEFTLFGEPKGSRDIRVPVISFTVEGYTPENLCQKIWEISKCRPTAHSSFYAARLFQSVLGPEAKDGVLRCSFLHYNTIEEVQALVQALKTILDG